MRTPNPSLCALAALGGAVFTSVCFFPGTMSYDPIQQLMQARAGQFQDWHPPLMAWWWGLLDKAYPGPAGMLVFHNALFWTGIGLFCHTLIRNRMMSALATLGTGFFPPVMALLGTILKDVGMGASLVLATGLLLHAHRNRARSSYLLSLLALFYGLAVRHNAMPAVLPLTLWAGFVGIDVFALKESRSNGLALGSAILLMLWLSVFAANRLLLKGSAPTYPYQEALAFDLVAISIASGTNYLPPRLFTRGEEIGVADMKRLYDPSDADNLYFSGKVLRDAAGPAELEVVWRAWRKAVSSHPGTYLRHRREVFSAMLGLGREHVCSPYYETTEPNSLGVSFRASRLNTWVMSRLAELKDTFLFRGWLYAALLCAMTALGFILPADTRRMALALGISGILYTGSFIPSTQVCHFRFNWWPLLAALLLALVFMENRLAGATDSRKGRGL